MHRVTIQNQEDFTLRPGHQPLQKLNHHATLKLALIQFKSDGAFTDRGHVVDPFTMAFGR
jgi:hypothetical protein